MPKRSAISKNSILAIIVVVIILIAGTAYATLYLSKTNSATTSQTKSGQTPLLLFSADAYANESASLERSFEVESGIPIITSVVAGSSTLAVDISSGDPVSVFLSVSRSSVQPTALHSQFPGWAISFAGDEMGIAYSQAINQSLVGKAVIASYETAISQNTTQSWYQFYDNLTSGSVKVGISNPNEDPAGFRAWIVLELAGRAYDSGNEQYFVDRLIQNQGNITGASAASLVPALVTGQIQFLFIYKSDIASEGLNLVRLANNANLGLASENGYYSKANYTTSGGIQKGAAIQLWITVPKDSTNPNESINFVVYTIQNYQTILQGFGLVASNPGILVNDSGFAVPSPIVTLLNSGALVDEGSV